MKNWLKDNGLVVIQLAIILIGILLMWSDGSNGRKEDMTILSYSGVVLIILGIGFQFILTGIIAVIKKLF